MSRRFHKKSKNGCLSCKRRHIKCDERQPSCVNCQISSFVCTYPIQPGSQSKRQNGSAVVSPASTSSSITARSDSGQQAAVQRDEPHTVVNLDHLELLCHFCFETWREFSSDAHQDQSMFNESIRELRRSVHTSPYLMYQALAIAALHLSIIRPEQTTHYRNLATDLQSQAVSLFKSAVLNVDDSNCIPAFLFSSFLAVYLLGDSVRYHQDNFDDFIQHFSQYLHLHRGVRAITNRFWSVISQTKLVPHTTQGDLASNAHDTAGVECTPLEDLLSSTHLDSETLQAYRHAIDSLRNTFDMCRSLSVTATSVHAVFAWPVLVSADYTNLLGLQKREALIILAYYAVLLHRHRHVWVFGDGGRFLIQSICNRFEDERLLAWPMAELNVNE